MEQSITTFEDYFKGFSPEVQEKLELIRQTVLRVVPEAKEVISYQMPTFKLNGKGLIYFAAWKHHIGLYPLTTAMESTLVEVVLYIGTKNSLQFALDQPIPVGLLERIVAFRVLELQAEE